MNLVSWEQHLKNIEFASTSNIITKIYSYFPISLIQSNNESSKFTSAIIMNKHQFDRILVLSVH